MVAAAAGTFARPGIVRQGWYLVERSSRVRAGQVRPIDLGARRVVVHRALDGCTEGRRCRFHGWCWGQDGSCVDAPGNPPPIRRRLRQYACAERWGFIWTWTGSDPAFPLPEVPPYLGRQIVPAPQRMKAHPEETRTRTMLFLRTRRDLPRTLAILWSTALDDLRTMERIRGTGAFAPADAALERYAGFVEALPAW